MALSFDTLSFAKRLTEAGEKPEVAEAHAMALKEFVMETVATKADVRELREEIQDLRDEIGDVRGELKEFRIEVGQEFAAVRSEMGQEFAAVRSEVRQEFAAIRSEVGQEFAAIRTGVDQEFTTVRSQITSLRKEFTERFATKDELHHEIGIVRKDIDSMGLKLTVRMGGMVAVAVGAVATLSRVL